ncbi:MAG: hypothetical protein M0Z84_03880 [Gammaproteobacteria bacterium]|nr:hypothetical protein [Gammaproteobacteria bacterium]
MLRAVLWSALFGLRFPIALPLAHGLGRATEALRKIREAMMRAHIEL